MSDDRGLCSLSRIENELYFISVYQDFLKIHFYFIHLFWQSSRNPSSLLILHTFQVVQCYRIIYWNWENIFINVQNQERKIKSSCKWEECPSYFQYHCYYHFSIFLVWFDLIDDLKTCIFFFCLRLNLNILFCLMMSVSHWKW